MDVQNIFRIDYESDYHLLEQNSFTKSILLERKNAKMSYPFVKIFKQKDYFEGIFMDRNQKGLKRIRYFPSVINGYYCFHKVEINDLIFKTSETYIYSILSIKKAAIPKAFFTANKMMYILKYFNKHIK